MDSRNHPAPRREVSVRRAPRYVPFMILGGVVGFAAAAVIAFALPGNPAYSAGAVFGFFLVACAIAGVLLGAVAALVFDRASTRRAQTAVLEPVPDAGTDSGPDGTGTQSPNS